MSRYQTFVVALLAFLQFTVVLDFVMLSPLGAVLMPELRMTPQQFGAAVSAYAFSAAVSGLLAAGFADRFDRKRFLLVFYGGFLLGTLSCGVATTYFFLVVARAVTGLFGGVIGAIVLAVATDLFPYDLRGRVMGIVQSAFAGSQVLGVPAALYVCNRWGWHAPFLLIVGVGCLVGIGLVLGLRPIDTHLKAARGVGPFAAARTMVATTHYLRAFGATTLLTIGGFLLLPFVSDFAVHNLGVPLAKLPLLYLVPGACSILTGPLAGRAADAFGKYRIFALGVLLSVSTVLVFTHLGTTPLPVVVLIFSLLFVGNTSRAVASQAMISAVPSAATRGAFLAVNASLQQLAGGVASVLAGTVVDVAPGGELLHFGTVGIVFAGASLLTLFLMARLPRAATTTL